MYVKKIPVYKQHFIKGEFRFSVPLLVDLASSSEPYTRCGPGAVWGGSSWHLISSVDTQVPPRPADSEAASSGYPEGIGMSLKRETALMSCEHSTTSVSEIWVYIEEVIVCHVSRMPLVIVC